jgi:hypothetical protein
MRTFASAISGSATGWLRKLALASAGGVVVVALATPAGASPERPAASTSDYGAFYMAVPSTAIGFGSVSATFRVPTVTCTAGKSRGEVFGVQAIIQGQLAGMSLVAALCNSGTPQYEFQVTANATTFIEPGANPGDLVVASSFQTANVIQSTIHDITSGATWVADGSPINNAGQALEIDVGVTNYTGSYPSWAPFTAITFSQVQVDGDYIGYQSPVQYNYKNGSVKAHTSALSDNGDSFKLTYG